MYSTIFYNHIYLDLEKCEEDLEIYNISNDGTFIKTDTVGYTYAGWSIYKLNVGSNYVLGPHIVTNPFDDYIKVHSTYNIYKIKKVIPSTPIFRCYKDTLTKFELIEANVIRSSNKLTYLNYLYGE